MGVAADTWHMWGSDQKPQQPAERPVEKPNLKRYRRLSRDLTGVYESDTNRQARPGRVTHRRKRCLGTRVCLRSGTRTLILNPITKLITTSV